MDYKKIKIILLFSMLCLALGCDDGQHTDQKVKNIKLITNRKVKKDKQIKKEDEVRKNILTKEKDYLPPKEAVELDCGLLAIGNFTANREAEKQKCLAVLGADTDESSKLFFYTIVENGKELGLKNKEDLEAYLELFIALRKDFIKVFNEPKEKTGPALKDYLANFIYNNVPAIKSILQKTIHYQGVDENIIRGWGRDIKGGQYSISKEEYSLLNKLFRLSDFHNYLV